MAPPRMARAIAVMMTVSIKAPPAWFEERGIFILLQGSLGYGGFQFVVVGNLQMFLGPVELQRQMNHAIVLIGHQVAQQVLAAEGELVGDGIRENDRAA